VKIELPEQETGSYWDIPQMSGNWECYLRYNGDMDLGVGIVSLRSITCVHDGTDDQPAQFTTYTKCDSNRTLQNDITFLLNRYSLKLSCRL